MGYDPEKRVNGLKIDPRIFTFGFGCKCNGECCHYGVYTDLKEHEMIMGIKDKVIALMDETQPKDIAVWFEKPSKDDDFPSGFAVGTELYNGKCVFLDVQGLCTLQKLAIEEGANPWKYKPIYCILFPFTVYEESFTIDDEHIDRLGHCNKNGSNVTPIYDSCREELEHFFGEDGFREVESIRVEFLNQIKPIEA